MNPPRCTPTDCLDPDMSDAVPAQPPAQAPSLHRRQALGAVLWATAAAVPLAMPRLARGGTPGVDEPPLPQPPRPVTVPPFQQLTLPNGLTVVLVPRRGEPLVSLVLAVRAGPDLDPPGHAGIAQMTAQLLTKGARRAGRNVDATTLARQAEALGSALESHSSWGVTSLGMTVTTPKLPAALALMADVLRQPLLAADELERARAQSLDGLRLALADPGQVANLVLRRAHWGDSPYGAVNTPAALARLQRDELRAFHRRGYRPDQALLVIAGDVDPARDTALARRLLGDWRAADDAASGSATTTNATNATTNATATANLASAQAGPRPLDTPLVLVDMPGTGQSSVAIAAPYLAQGSPERFAGLLANAVLGGGYSARLNQEVRIKRGLSYGVGSGVEANPPGGMFSASAQTNHPTALQVLQILRAEVQRLADSPPGADELAARQATLVGAFARRMDGAVGLAGLVLGEWAQQRPLADLNGYTRQVLAVTPQQVADFARRHWPADSLRAVVAGDLTAAGEGLRAGVPADWQVPLAALDLEAPRLRRP